MDTIVSRRVTDLRRLNNTVNGNPRWKVGFESGHAITAPDVADAFVIGDWMIGLDIRFTLDGRGRIIRVLTEQPNLHQRHRREVSA